MPRKTQNTKDTIVEKKVTNSSTKKITKNVKSTKKTSSKSSVKNKKNTTTIKKDKTKQTHKKEKIEIIPVEYYDLPYRYNQTIIKLLAQTPNTLFIYWDISDKDRENYKKQYGDNFFETTTPILIVHNDTLNYSYEVEINDFANSWYLHVNDSKSNYRIELGRRPITYNKNIDNNYILITSSNEIESPNDHILFDKSQHMVYFRNVKTNTQKTKNISNLDFIKNMGKIYNIYDLYKKIYKDENIYDNSNPSSQFNTIKKGEL